jgi:hypothetical protein
MRGALYLHDTTRGSKDDPHHAVDHPSEGAPLLVLRARQRDIEHVDVFLGSLRRRVHGLVGQICGAVNIGTTAAVLWSAACLRQTTTAWHINSDRERGERVLEVRGRPPPPASPCNPSLTDEERRLGRRGAVGFDFGDGFVGEEEGGVGADVTPGQLRATLAAACCRLPVEVEVRRSVFEVILSRIRGNTSAGIII